MNFYEFRYNSNAERRIANVLNVFGKIIIAQF